MTPALALPKNRCPPSSCYIFAVLPSLEIRWLRSSATAIGLFAAVLTLLLWASRYALLEVWPERVQELWLSNGDVLFVSARKRPPDLDVVASSHPRSLLALEWPDGRLAHGFVVLDQEDPDGWWMEFASGPERVHQSELVRYYTPNSMLLGERLALLADRLQERRASGQSAAFGRQSLEDDSIEDYSQDSIEPGPDETEAAALVVGEGD